MHSMQRQFGKLLNKGPGDNAKVSVLLSDYGDVDKVLAKIIDDNKSWRDSWMSLIYAQLQIVTEYESLYDPIVGASDGHGQPAEPTSELQLHRTYGLKRVYDGLKTELIEEMGMIEERIIKPATEARDCLHPFRKLIEKRENKRLDYERAQEKTQKLARKGSRTAKEEGALAKAEEEVGRVSEKFNAADENLRSNLPPIVTAAFSLVPSLLAAHVLIHNRLLGLYYTTLHDYCEQSGFPSPPPPMEEVIATWNASFHPVQSKVESISFIARGKATHQPMTMNTANERKPSESSAMPKLGFRRSSSNLFSGQANSEPTSRNLRLPSVTGLRAPPSPSASDASPNRSPRPSPTPSFRKAEHLAPTDFTTATILGGGTVDRSPARSPGASPNSMHPRADYFGGGGGGGGNNRERPSTASTIASSISLQGSQTMTPGPGANNGYGIAAAAKKKPPPPPPKRKPSMQRPEEWVVARYEFAGQGQGDLSFREGDRIKIVKKTETDQDWWVGELNGVRGSFPANYCQGT